MTAGDPTVRVGLTGVTAFLPERTLTSREVEDRIARHSDGYRPLAGIVTRMTGIRSRHLAADDQQASDLAAAAARSLLERRGLTPGDVDLLIFGSASQDLVEPATAHIVSAKLGTTCPVFDVTNACNSFLNALQVAEALIRTGQHARALVCTGEIPSRAIRWKVRDFKQFVESFPGYTLSDGGAAALLEPVPRGGIFHRAFEADSTAWNVGTLPGGGTMHPRDPEYTYFHADGRRLKDAFLALGSGLFDKALADTGLSWDDFAVICVHQVAMPYLELLREQTGIPADRLVVTLPEHGNLASVTLPLQLATALEEGRCGPGDRVALLGLAGGVSLGVIFLEL
ncbi:MULTISPECIES: 3-oxoacyl-ACP synthase III family protein [Thermomonospora]|uniref:Beta-ketoacyl-acyl-carrier-protein synthase I n=1 Tax=Thermomonospora curvata (strain ATCC 19995 / DSM 43183 / JCM 3096 / KCTC 9072 / NBRC 15933 / NCIMB 10081 / Henssen B9) TaxID=471852 RepID=D1AES8_THECD|nr:MULTISPECIES: ketoacyl-ACP synthase III [Thermomonospora]ACY97653.1 Beta-ketoacyl-acyl-carrier-protein synthase I [Thermomonospora curvata DSM 43183]PKK14399.1 MAG: ketoacyl-ACP synthase III [Thermomonospora sp. CIF 1]